MGNSNNTLVVQYTNKAMYDMSKRKLAIELHKQDNILNKRTEIMNKCSQAANTTWRNMTPKNNTKLTIKSTQ